MVTPLYAGILGLLYVAISAYTILGRFKHNVNLGDGDNEDMFKRIRIHSNFIEYVPFALLLMVLAEVEGSSETLIHVLGVALVIGRIIHPFGVARVIGPSIGRSGGMILTFLVIITAAILCIKSYFIF